MHVQVSLEERSGHRGTLATGRPYLSIPIRRGSVSRRQKRKGLAAGGASTVTWIIVANGCRARIFEKDGPGAAIRPATPGDFYGDFTMPGQRSRAMSMQSFREPGDDERKRDFARAVARLLEQFFSKGRFDQLVLVAPPQTLGDLDGALPVALRARVVCNIQRNLMNVASFELADYLGAALRD